MSRLGISSGRTISRRRKQTDFILGLPCNSCNGDIPYDAKYLELTKPNETKIAICVICESGLHLK